MLITPAFAQAANGAATGMDANSIIVQLVPIGLLIIIFWLLIFRPQQKRIREQRAMLAAIRRGDTVVTSGGIVGKVTRAQDNEDLEVEIAQGVKVKIARSAVTDVRSKSEPVADTKAAS